MPATDRRLVTLAEGAAYAKQSKLTIRRRIADGSLPAYRLGPRAIRIDLDDLDRLLRPIPTAEAS